MKKSLISLVAVGFLASCGGGGSSSSDTPSINIDNGGSDTKTPSTNTDNGDINNTVNPPADYSIPTISEVDKNKFLDAINDARAEARDCNDGKGVVPAVDPLTWNDDLYKASYEHNYDMTNSNSFDHNGSGTQYDITGANLGRKSLPWDRVKFNGYIDTGVTTGYGAGENLAGGQNTIEEALSTGEKNWLHSADHCANIMNGNFTEMGLSKVAISSGGFLWTNVFGYKK